MQTGPDRLVLFSPGLDGVDLSADLASFAGIFWKALWHQAALGLKHPHAGLVGPGTATGVHGGSPARDPPGQAPSPQLPRGCPPPGPSRSRSFGEAGTCRKAQPHLGPLRGPAQSPALPFSQRGEVSVSFQFPVCVRHLAATGKHERKAKTKPWP